MRSSARRCGAACRVGVGWKRQLSSAFPPVPPAPPRLHPRRGTPPLLPRAQWRVSGVPIPPGLPATFPRCWVRRLGGRCSARPHPTPRAFARGAGHDCLPSPTGRGPRRCGSSGRVSRAVRRDGLAAPRRGAARLAPSPPAAGPGLVCLGRSPVVCCSGPAARSPGASPRPPSGPLGASSHPRPQPRLLRLSVRFSRPLCPPLPLSCVPLPAWRHASRRSPPFPLPSVVVGGGCPGTRARVRGAPVDGVGGES